MTDIGAVKKPTEARLPIEERQKPERDGGRQPRPRRPRKRPGDADTVEVEPHTLDFEA